MWTTVSSRKSNGSRITAANFSRHAVCKLNSLTYPCARRRRRSPYRLASLTSVQAEYLHPPTLQSPVHFSLVLGLGWLLQKRSSTFSILPSSLLYLEQ